MNGQNSMFCAKDGNSADKLMEADPASKDGEPAEPVCQGQSEDQSAAGLAEHTVNEANEAEKDPNDAG